METTKDLETIKQQSGSSNCGALRRSLSIYRSRSFTAKNKDAPRVPLKRSKTLRFFTTTVPKILYVTPESKAQPTAPLLIKDPLSSDNGSELDDIKTTPIDPTHLNGSSGNFGSTTGPRSAPSTPQQQQQPQQPVITPITIHPYNSGGLEQPPCTTPGCTSSSSPSIQRSPSHNLFSKCDNVMSVFVKRKKVAKKIKTMLNIARNKNQRNNDNISNYSTSSSNSSSDSTNSSERNLASLKHLSTSAPTMTAQAQLPEPPSPKTTKEAKVPTMLKNRQKKFSRHFPSVDDEKVLNYYSCALIGDILLQGHLYITKNYFAFYSNVFGYVTKLLIPMLSVEKITKEKTARIIPNAVGIATSEDKHVFGSLMSRDNTYRYMVKVWEVAQNASMLVVEPEIEPVQVSDSDSSETRDGESGRESPLPPITMTNRLPISDNIPMTTNNKNSKDTKLHKEGTLVKDSIGNNSNSRHSLEIMNVLKQNISKFSRLPRQSLILYATTLLLILLFLSAAVLLYRISKIQNRFSSALHDTIILNSDKNNNGNNANSNNKNNNNDNNDKNNNKNDEIYNNLYQWQTHLHTKSAGAVHNFLDTNLDQIAKVRQSLEALSALLTATPDRQQEPTNS